VQKQHASSDRSNVHQTALPALMQRNHPRMPTGRLTQLTHRRQQIVPTHPGTQITSNTLKVESLAYSRAVLCRQLDHGGFPLFSASQRAAACI
jgi:hypothetical protein